MPFYLTSKHSLFKLSKWSCDSHSRWVFSLNWPQRWQYDQWRFTDDIPVDRYKPLCGADTFKSLLRPLLVILRVELNPYSTGAYLSTTKKSSQIYRFFDSNFK